MINNYRITYYDDWVKIEIGMQNSSERKLLDLLAVLLNTQKAIVIEFCGQILAAYEKQVNKLIEMICGNKTLNIAIYDKKKTDYCQNLFREFDIKLEKSQVEDICSYMENLTKHRSIAQIKMIKECICRAKPDGDFTQVEEEFKAFCSLVLRKEKINKGI